MAGRRVTSTAMENELQILFDEKACNCHFKPTSFCQSVLGGFFRQAAQSLPLHCCILLLVKSQVSLAFIIPSSVLRTRSAETKKINYCSVQHIHLWGHKQSQCVDTSCADHAESASCFLHLVANFGIGAQRKASQSFLS